MDNKGKIYVTREGYEAYLAELENAKKALAEVRKTRSEYGQNSTDDYKTGDYDRNERIAYASVAHLQEEIARMEIVTPSENKDLITIGDIVTVLIQSGDDSHMQVVKLTGGSPMIGSGDEIPSISLNSPIGKAIYQRKVGEQVEAIAGGKNKLHIMIISREVSNEKSNEKQPGQN